MFWLAFSLGAASLFVYECVRRKSSLDVWTAAFICVLVLSMWSVNSNAPIPLILVLGIVVLIGGLILINAHWDKIKENRRAIKGPIERQR